MSVLAFVDQIGTRNTNTKFHPKFSSQRVRLLAFLLRLSSVHLKDGSAHAEQAYVCCLLFFRWCSLFVSSRHASSNTCSLFAKGGRGKDEGTREDRNRIPRTRGRRGRRKQERKRQERKKKEKRKNKKEQERRLACTKAGEASFAGL